MLLRECLGGRLGSLAVGSDRVPGKGRCCDFKQGGREKSGREWYFTVSSSVYNLDFFSNIYSVCRTGLLPVPCSVCRMKYSNQEHSVHKLYWYSINGKNKPKNKRIVGTVVVALREDHVLLTRSKSGGYRVVGWLWPSRRPGRY